MAREQDLERLQRLLASGPQELTSALTTDKRGLARYRPIRVPHTDGTERSPAGSVQGGAGGGSNGCGAGHGQHRALLRSNSAGRHHVRLAA